MKAENFLKDADLLFHANRFDSCVSRCYYALYHLIIALLETQGIRSKEWDHGFVLGEFTKAFVHRKKKFARDFVTQLYDIRKQRNEADYSIFPVSAKKAKRVFDKTNVLWNNLRRELQYEKQEST